MQDLQIVGLPHQKKGKKNLVNVATYEDRVNRDFQAVESNSLWLTDITEHPTREGKIYCCAVLDLFSSKIVGWSVVRQPGFDAVLIPWFLSHMECSPQMAGQPHEAFARPAQL